MSEVDFLVDVAGGLELFEAKWSEVPEAGDAVNLDFVRSVVGKPRIVSSAIVCGAPNSYPLTGGSQGDPCDGAIGVDEPSKFLLTTFDLFACGSLRKE